MSLSVAKTSTLIGCSVTVNNYPPRLYCSLFALCWTNMKIVVHIRHKKNIPSRLENT